MGAKIDIITMTLPVPQLSAESNSTRVTLLRAVFDETIMVSRIASPRR